MTDFTDNLWSDLMREHGSTLAHTERPEKSRLARLWPRALAGSSLGLAGVGAALVLALGGSTAAPALAVTTQQDGSVLVQVNPRTDSAPWLQAAEAKLAALGTDERILVAYAPGAATTPGPVSCTPMTGVNTPSGPPVKVLLGTNGTLVTPAGTTGAGTVHLSGCEVFKTPVPGGGNTGTTGAN
jgi:hypothetical protein